MTTTSTFVGIADNQRISSRVLKPPGGGSTISFGDDSDLNDIKRKSTKVQDDPKKKAQQSPEARKSTQVQDDPKKKAQQSPEAESNEESSLQTPEENDNTSIKQSSPSSGSSTPNYSKLDTQGRLFGEESQDNSGRKVRDHQRSRIFSDGDENSTTKPESSISRENKEDKIHKPSQPQKQRVPPGGPSSKLW